MRILQITNGYPPSAIGGVEVYTQRIARALRAAGHEIVVLCREDDPHRDDYDVITEVSDEGITVYRIVNNFRAAVTLRNRYRDATIERIVARLLAEVAPHMVHIQHAIGLSAAVPALVAAAGLPSVLTMHDYWWLCPRVNLLTNRGHRCGGPVAGADCFACLMPLGRVSSLIYRLPPYQMARRRLTPEAKMRLFGLLARISPHFTAPADLNQLDPFTARLAEMLAMLELPDLLTTPSQFVKDRYVDHGLRADRIRVVPLGVGGSGELGGRRGSAGSKVPDREELRERKGTEGTLRVGYIGHLQQHKGAHVLLEAVITRPNLPVTVVFYGRGNAYDPYPDQLRARAADDPRLHFAGLFPAAELATVLANLDVLVVPSLAHETYSFVVREAFTAGVPVIASSVGAIPEVVDDGRNGFLVPPGNPAAVAERLALLAGDRERLRAMRQAAAERGRTVTTADQHLTTLEALYTEVAVGRTDANPFD